jgi:muconolactone delta-isomerase
MSQFMVEFELPNPFPEKLIMKIPEQRATINRLLEKGKIQSYALSMERDRLWCVVNADDELEAMRIIGEFPLKDFMESKITELMFNNAVVMRVPSFSLN